MYRASKLICDFAELEADNMLPGFCTRYTSRDIGDRRDDLDSKRDGVQIVGC